MALTLAAHPRLILDAPTLARMRLERTNNTPLWATLDNLCNILKDGETYLPDGQAYPSGNGITPDVGQGYQGDEYIKALLNLAIGYQVLREDDPVTAEAYGRRGVDILMAMAEPYPGHGQNPLADDGYGIRNYGVGMGLGYDWLFDLLTTEQKAQICTTANNWVSKFETGSFEFNHPLTNYFAGYFCAKCMIALGTYDENPQGDALWTDWRDVQFGQRLQPYFAAHMTGGGWPEGYGNYGMLATMNMTLPAWAVKTATGEDLTVGAAPYTYPIDAGAYLMHFTWPSRLYIDDRDCSHANGNPDNVPCTSDPDLFALAGSTLERYASPNAPVFRAYAAAVSDALNETPSGWSTMLSLQTDTDTAPIDSLPLSYIATGMNSVTARSDWTVHARWMSVRGGPYVNNPNQHEQMCDQGSLALVKGGRPLLVNTWGWMIHEPGGVADEERLYSDELGNSDAIKSQYVGNSQCYNVFYVRDMAVDGVTPNQPFGQGSYTAEDYNVRTATQKEDGGIYAYSKSTHIEDMYVKFTAGPAVKAWSREVLYLRPNRFIVFDRTEAGALSYDQYLAWHFSANPVTDGDALKVTYQEQYMGAMTPVLPANAQVATIALYPDSPTPKVWQSQVRAGTKAAVQKWLTVFDMAPNTAAITTLASASSAVLLNGDDGASVVAFANSEGSLNYTDPGIDASHVVAGLTPGTMYDVAVGGGAVAISTGTTFRASDMGVLAFDVVGGAATEPAEYTGADGSLDDITLPVIIGGGGDGGDGGGDGGGDDGGGDTGGGSTGGGTEQWNVTFGNTYSNVGMAIAEAVALAMQSPEQCITVSKPNYRASLVSGTGFAIKEDPAHARVTVPAVTAPADAGYRVAINYSPVWVVEAEGFTQMEAALAKATTLALTTPDTEVQVVAPSYGITYTNAAE